MFHSLILSIFRWFLSHCVFQTISAFVRVHLFVQRQKYCQNNFGFFCRSLTLFLKRFKLRKDKFFTSRPVEQANGKVLPIESQNCYRRLEHWYRVKKAHLDVAQLVVITIFLKHAGVETTKLFFVEIWQYFVFVRMWKVIAVDVKDILWSRVGISSGSSLASGGLLLHRQPCLILDDFL